MERMVERMTYAELTEAIGSAYDRGYQKGRMDRERELAEAGERRRAFYERNKVEEHPSLDDLLKNKKLQAEFDRRISKALDTARANWEQALEAAGEIDPIPGEEAQEVRA